MCPDARQLGSAIFQFSLPVSPVRWGVAGRTKVLFRNPESLSGVVGCYPAHRDEYHKFRERSPPPPLPPPPAEKAEHKYAFSDLNYAGIRTITIVLEIPSGSFNWSKPV